MQKKRRNSSECVADYYTPAMLGLKTDQEVLGELIKVKAPAVGQLMAQYPGIWTLVVSRWFICLYIDVLPIEVRQKLRFSGGVKLEACGDHLTDIHLLSYSCRLFCGSGIVFSTRDPKYFSAWLLLSYFTTRQRSWERALCLTCANASNRSLLGLSL